MIKIQLLAFNVHHAHIKEAGSRPGRPPWVGARVAVTQGWWRRLRGVG